MQIAKLQIDRFGVWKELALGPLANGLNVLWGQETEDRTSIVEFVRSVLYGFRDDQRKRFFPLSANQAGGSLTLAAPHGLHTVHRYDEGNSQGRLLVENETGAVTSKHRLQDLLHGVAQGIFERIFLADFHQRCEVGHLVDAAIEHGIPIVGGHGDVTRLTPLRQRLSEQRQLLERMTTGRSALAALLERRRSLRTEIEALQATISQVSEQDKDKRRQLQAELVDLEQQLDDLRVQFAALDTEIEMRRQERSQKAAELEQDRIGARHQVVQRRQQIEEIDGQLQRWRGVLSEVHSRRELLQTDDVPAETVDDGTTEPRHYLRRLEEQVEQLQGSVQELQADGDPMACVCQRLRGDLMPALHAMQENIYRLCNQLSVWEANARRTANSGELSQTERCESELRQAISGLTMRRQQLAKDLASHYDAAHLLTPMHGDLCRCNEHPDDVEILAAAENEDLVLDAELLAVLDVEIERLLQRRRDLSDDIQEVEDELGRLRIRLEQLEQQHNDGQHQVRLEAKQRELQQIEQQICDGERHRDVEAGIRELEAEIRALETATRQSQVLREAGELLRRMSGDELQQISVTPERTVRVHNRHGALLPLGELIPSHRDQVYLSFCLALNAAFGRDGVHLPLVLHDALVHQDTLQSQRTATVLADFGRPGRQILLMLGSGKTAELFTDLTANIRQLPNPRVVVAPAEPAVDLLNEQRRLELNRQLHAIAEQTSEARPVADYQAFSAEEFPGELTDRSRAAASESETDVDDEQASTEYFLLESSLIMDAPSIDAATAERFRKIGVLYVRDLLRLDIDDAARRLRHAGITPGMIRRWQAEALLVCRVRRLRPYDARILVGSGIETPHELASLDADELRQRVETFASTATGQVLLHSGNGYELSRLTNWILQAQQSDIYRGNGQQRRSEPRSQRYSESRRQNSRSNGRQHRGYDDRQRRVRSDRSTTEGRPSSNGQNGERHSSRRDPQSKTGQALTANSAVVLKMDQEPGSLRFYLNTADPVEAAPSIGPRTAERLEKIGIRTVTDLLSADSENVAERLNHRYIKADTIRQWQQQTVLVCCVPQMRGHDSQILVACGVLTPETLAATDPSELWAKVEPFSETSEGKRIIRSGKAPDFEEVYSWIQWAGQARQLRAA